MSKEDNNGSIDYQKLNSEEIKKFFNDSKIDFNPKVKITDKQFNDNISKLIKPNININSNSYTSEQEYISKVSDPFKRMQQLKAELLKNKKDIDNAISKYNDISTQVDISDINNYSILYSNAQRYKNKVDSFINYDIIKSRLNKKGMDSDSDSEDEEDDNDEQKKAEKAKENKTKKEEKKNNILKKREENEKILKELEENSSILFKENENIKSLNEKYDILSNNLISKLNNIDSDLNLYMKYKICSNPDYNLSSLKSRIVEVDKEITRIENIIGDYDFNLHKSTIFGCLKNFLKLSTDNNKDWIANRHENIRAFEGMISLFLGEEENTKLMEIYKMICEAYMIYLSMKKFEDVISYLKKRINAIKNVILNSEQFDYEVKELNELIQKNESNYEIMKFKYFQTLECFSNLEEILKEVNNLDIMIKKKI